MITPYVVHDTDGVEDTFTVPFPYLHRSHVVVKLDGVVQSSGYSWLTSGTIQFTSAPAAGTGMLRIERQTPTDPLVQYSPAAALALADLQTDALQTLYRLEEMETIVDEMNLIVEEVLEIIEEADPSGAQMRADLISDEAAKGAALVQYDTSRTVKDKLSDTVSIKDHEFGGVGDGVADDSLAFRALVTYAKANPGVTCIVPKGDYRLITASAITSISGGSCVPMDGVSDLRIVGQRGARILMEADDGRVNAFCLYVSSASETAGDYAQRVSIEGLEFVYTRAGGFEGNISTILYQGSEDCAVIGCKIDHSAALGGTFGISGAGRRNRYIDNELIGVATCFDTSHNEDCTYRGNMCRGMSNAVTAFNHFHDANSSGDMRWEHAMSQDIGSGNLYEDNEVIGYGAAFALRGMRDSWVQRNRIHGFTANDATTRNMISIYSQDEEVGTDETVRNIIIRDNLIYDINNDGAGVTRGIFINQSIGEMEVSGVRIVGNIIHDIGGTGAIGISWSGATNDFQLAQNIVDASTVALPNSFNRIDIVPAANVGESPEIKVTGDADLILKPGPDRYVRFGERVLRSDTSITGTVHIRTEDGTDVYLATCAP